MIPTHDFDNKREKETYTLELNNINKIQRRNCIQCAFESIGDTIIMVGFEHFPTS